MRRVRIEITGIVQGVGFRPFVYGLACEKGLAGFVRNSSSGVEIEVEGSGVDDFVTELRNRPPPLAAILDLTTEELTPQGGGEFSILASSDEGRSTHLSPDVSTCGDCFSEMLDPSNRRYLYPFINCTNCGPRYSITKGVPYDRPNTTMALFEMCRECRREYDDPLDRRFHAQPNACSICGPEVRFVTAGREETGREALKGAIALLRQGGVVAVKGIGGYHLAVDGANAAAVARLREHKRKSNKAFALMVSDIEHIRRYAFVSDDEAVLLRSRERPIVLLRRREDEELPETVAPGVPELGFMLPYSPLHALLFSQPAAGSGPSPPNFRVLVMTSGNLSEEPVIKNAAAAEERLSFLSDGFLHHDRGIFMRVDDSVVRRFEGQTVFIRRARGYVPSAIPLGEAGEQVLACGADLKNTFCLTTAEAAVVSQHIGDMESMETLRFFEETLANLKEVYRVAPVALAHDLHPGYFSTCWALEQEGLEKYGIQHHYSHVGSVMAEAGLEGPVIGVALDGSGYGGDGTVWGGEFLLADRRGFERRAHFRAVPMPGGDAAARKPWQMALSYLADALDDETGKAARALGLEKRHGAAAIENILRIGDNRTLSPLTSGAGRLFESIAAILGLCDVNTYEGEAAMALEAAAASGATGAYPYAIKGSTLREVDFSESVRRVAHEAAEGGKRSSVAARFHNTVAEAVVETAALIHGETGIDDILLTGGVFQNRHLLGRVVAGLTALGLHPRSNRLVPANDAGVSLGQAWILRGRLQAR